jgi:hypothetical protein
VFDEDDAALDVFALDDSEPEAFVFDEDDCPVVGAEVWPQALSSRARTTSNHEKRTVIRAMHFLLSISNDAH